MSTAKINRIVGSSTALPEVDGLMTRQAIIASSNGQTVFDITMFTDDKKIRAFILNEEVSVSWDSGKAKLKDAVAIGTQVDFYGFEDRSSLKDAEVEEHVAGSVFSKYIRDDKGDIVGGAECAVYVGGTGVLATNLRDKHGAPLANPFTTGEDGLVQFIADPGKYTLQVSFDLIVHTYSVYFADDGLRNDLADSSEGAGLIAYGGTTVESALEELEQFNADLANPGKGAAMVARGVVAVDSITDLVALPEGQRKEGLRYLVKGYHAGSDVGGGEFYWDASSTAVADGGTVFAASGSSSGRFLRIINDPAQLVFGFGAKGDGVSDDTAPMQQHLNWCNKNRRTAFYPSASFVISDTLILDQAGVWSSVHIKGSGGGEPYGKGQYSGTTIIRLNPGNIFKMTSSYPASGVTIEGVKMIGSSEEDMSFLLEIDQTPGRQLKNLWIDQVCCTHGGLLHIYSTGDSSNAPYIYISKTYCTATQKIVYTENVGMTICSVSESLYHMVRDYAFHLRSGEVGFSGVWFESCSPAAVYKPSSNFLNLNLHNVYFENMAARNNPEFTSLIYGNNTTVTITGNTNLPGSFMEDNPFNHVGANSYLANYSNSIIPVRGTGIVTTPESIRPHPKFKSLLHYRASDIQPLGGDVLKQVFAKSWSGTLLTPDATDKLPSKIDKLYGLYRGEYIVRGGVTDVPIDATNDRMLYLTYAYQSSDVDNGIGTTASFTIDGEAQSFGGYGYTYPREAVSTPMVAVVACPLPAGSAVSNATFQLRGANTAWASAASALVGPSVALSNLVPQERERTFTLDVEAGASEVFDFKQRKASRFSVELHASVNRGQGGLYELKSWGLTTNGSKQRAESNHISESGVTIQARDGAHDDVVNLLITNNSATACRVDITLTRVG